MKHLRLFNSKSELVTAKNNGLAMPNVSLVKGESKCYYFGDTEAGDIAFYDGDMVRFCSADNWDDSLGTPIGVVVVPSTHREDGKSVIMSLANMSLQTPETGSLAEEPISGDNYMMWGKYGTDLNGLANYDCVPVIDPEDGTSNGTNSYGYMYTDLTESFTTMENEDGEATTNEDEATYKCVHTIENGYIGYVAYYRDSTDDDWEIDEVCLADSCIASPYNADGSKNEDFQMDDTAFEVLDGKDNTNVIVNAISATYKGGTTVQDVQDAYPAANCTSRYHTQGTNKGDWYLPSIGEIAYLFARISKIAKAINVLGSKAVMFKYYPNYGWLWSSTEYSSHSAWGLYAKDGLSCGYTENYSDSNLRVRAFCAL